jgi:hypothetical protein
MRAARNAIYDIAFPANAEEYKLLGKHAVLFVIAVTRDKAELPCKRIYLKQGKHEIDMQIITARQVKVADPVVQKAFGTYSQEILYLLPMYLIQAVPNLMIDWATNRNEFFVGEIGNHVLGMIPYFKNDTNNTGASLEKTDKKALERMMIREFVPR